SAWLARASARKFAGEIDAAVSDCDRAIAIDPGLVESYFWRASAHDRAGRHEQMVADFSRYIELVPTPKDWREHNCRAWAFHRIGQPDRALADADRALELGPREATALDVRGQILASLGRWEEAKADLAAALAANPPAFCASDVKAALEKLDRGSA